MNETPAKVQTLHLSPRSRPAQRIWRIGGNEEISFWDADLRLSVLPDRHENFATLKSILAQLARYARPEHLSQLAQLAKLNSYLDQVDIGAAAGAGGVGKFLTDSVTFAIMRRISRESVYTARIIELGARVINDVLSKIPGCERVHVELVDRLDRPTLKVLARAVLLLEPAHEFSWVWHLESDPTAEFAGEADDLYLHSRHQLLRQLMGILAPTLKRIGGARPLARPAALPENTALYDVGAALVMQNYDACFLWCEKFLHGDDELATEGLRLTALAAVNIGAAEDALRVLRLAETLTKQPGRRAHLSYLQGLIEAKRTYDLPASTSHYERGLSYLANEGDMPEDLPLERAWLCNGIALNEAILWRRNPGAMEHYAKAFALEREAFSYVAEGDDPARTYLRFNLLANSAFLLEMQKKYDLAIDIFHQAFDLGPEASSEQGERWRNVMGYRLGVLHYRAGRSDVAYRMVSEAAQYDVDTENWATQERVLRAQGFIALDLKMFSEAAAIFAQGLDVCRAARSAKGAQAHARGLIAALMGRGKRRQALNLCDTLRAEEGAAIIATEQPYQDWIDGSQAPESPAPKLPAYIPEIDLEGIPAIDLNRFLGKAPAAHLSQSAPWRD